jgi:protein SCO1
MLTKAAIKGSLALVAAAVKRTEAAIAISVVMSLAGTYPSAGLNFETGPARINPRKAYETSQSAIGRPVADHQLIASDGDVLPLASYRGKPLIVSLVYTSCGSICPLATQRLRDAVGEASRVIGAEKFAVLTVGFDAKNDTPSRMALFAANQHVGSSNWRVASADSETIEALLKDLGFTYSEIAGGFDHVTQTTIIGSDGRIFRQVYGEFFPIQMFMEPLKDAVYGRTTASWSAAGMIDRIRFICTTFDPAAGHYRIDYGLVFGGLLGALSLILMGAVILREWLRTARLRQT